MEAKEMYELQRRPGDPAWFRLPYLDREAQQKYGCWGREHWIGMERRREH